MTAKEKILQEIQNILDAFNPGEDRWKHALTGLQTLRKDILEAYNSIVVVGEFKNGKSTFINALLGENLLPVDVTPTTAALHVLMWGEDRKLHVVKRNGETETGTLDVSALQPFSAGSHSHEDDISYLKAEIPVNILKNRVVLIDTPGVNDLNEHRAEITHQFIPKADIIFFMFSATDPLKKTEQIFIKEHVMKYGSGKVVYLANFIDRLEEEELEETMTYLSRRLTSVTGDDSPVIIPISSLEGLDAKLRQDEELYESSGMKEVDETIHAILASPGREEEKNLRYKARFEFELNVLQNRLDMEREIASKTADEAQEQLFAVQQWLNQAENRDSHLTSYIHEREGEILFLIRKSLAYFETRLKEDAEDRIHYFQGGDLHTFVHSQLLIHIKSQVNRWLEEYGEYIHHLLHKLEAEVAAGLSRSFSKSVKIESYQASRFTYRQMNDLTVPEAGNANVKAGLMIGGASAFALALGGGFLIPVIGMAGLPFLQKTLNDNKLQQLKPELKLQMDAYLSALVQDLYTYLSEKVVEAIDQCVAQSLVAFQKEIYAMTYMMEKKLNDRTQSKEHTDAEIQAIDDLSKMLTNSKETVGGYHERISNR
ncbi:dynamin family protein [Metabacillus indicus]|uniref:dynamin family protein n=1 Tax=Metabacillus indicus TaxID=246786 RepID=UPI00049314DA|nr:dynamin family protein [Metabacillus indicus]KEZ48798.1 hypothetical protein AZ46_0218115 [Metabacillus indicus LMG 22858]